MFASSSTDDIEWVTLRGLYPPHLAVKHSDARLGLNTMSYP